MEHLIKDYREGPEASRTAHYEEWVRCVEKIPDGSQFEKRVEVLMQRNYNLHFHSWTSGGLLEFFLTLGSILPVEFEIEHFSKYKGEAIFVLKKL